MASSSGNTIYESGEDRRPEWTGATAGYNEAGEVGVTIDRAWCHELEAVLHGYLTV